MAEYISIVYIFTTPSKSQLYVDGHFGCFHVLAIVSNAFMNTGVSVPFQIRVFTSSAHVPGSGMAGSYGSSLFCFLRQLHTIFYSDYTNLYSEITHPKFTSKKSLRGSFM